MQANINELVSSVSLTVSTVVVSIYAVLFVANSMGLNVIG